MTAPATALERVWLNPDEQPIYRSNKHGVGIYPDAFPKFPDQVLIMPARGFPERQFASLHDLDLHTQLALTVLQTIVQRRMESFSGVDGVRGIVRVDGFAVPNHPHIVMFPGLRGESSDYTQPPRPQFEGAEVRQKLIEATLRNLCLTAEQMAELDELLDQLPRI